MASPSYIEAQSLTFTYANNVLTQVKSNYNDYVNLSYDEQGNLINVSHRGLIIAQMDYFENSNYLSQITDVNNNGYRFINENEQIVIPGLGSQTIYYSKITNILGIHAPQINETLSYASLSGYERFALIIERNENGTDYSNQYAFDTSGKLLSAYSQYEETQSESSIPKQITTNRTWNSTDNMNKNRETISYTEDLQSVPNGSFNALSGGVPEKWTITNGAYISGDSLRLPQNASASTQAFSFTPKGKSEYVLSFMAAGNCENCTLDVDVYSAGTLHTTVYLNELENYYAETIGNVDGAVGNCTIRIKATCPSCSGSIILDDVSISPVDSYTLEEYKYGADSEITFTSVSPYQKTVTTYNKYSRPLTSTITEKIDGKIETTDYIYGESYYDYRLIREERNDETIHYTYNDAGLVETVEYTNTEDNTLNTLACYQYDLYGNIVRAVESDGTKTYYKYETENGNRHLKKAIVCTQSNLYDENESHSSHDKDYIETYSYDNYGRLIKIDNGYSYNNITYGANGQMEYGSKNSSVAHYVNEYGQVGCIAYDGGTAIGYKYGADNQLISKEYYNSDGTHQIAEYGYDSYGQIKSVVYKNKLLDADGNIIGTEITDSYTMSEDRAANRYTLSGNGVTHTFEGRYSVAQSREIYTNGSLLRGDFLSAVNAAGSLGAEMSSVVGGDLSLNTTSQYFYDNESRVTSMTETFSTLKNEIVSSDYAYDDTDRLKSYQLEYGDKSIFKLNYGYKTATVNNQTSATDFIVSEINGADLSNVKFYDYDGKGNLTKIQQANLTAGLTFTTLNTYAYDSSNKLIGETIGGSSYGYAYDDNYNIKSVTLNGSIAESYNYNGDRMTSAVKDGETKYFAYDGLGNPVKYKVSSANAQDNMEWTQGNRLVSGTLNGTNFVYEYDASGNRSKKTVGGTTTYYVIRTAGL